MKEITDSEIRQHVSDIADILRTNIQILINNRKANARIGKKTIIKMIDDLDEALDKTNELVGDTDLRFNNHYRCSNGHELVEWNDQWDSQCDDECPQCGTPITPYLSEDTREGQ